MRAIENAVIGLLATLLLELADMSGPEPDQYHRQQEADDENQHGLPAEPAHQIIAARLGVTQIAVLCFGDKVVLTPRRWRQVGS